MQHVSGFQPFRPVVPFCWIKFCMVFCEYHEEHNKSEDKFSSITDLNNFIDHIIQNYN